MKNFTFTCFYRQNSKYFTRFLSNIFFFLLLASTFQIYAQNSYERQLKYWYLRDRLRYFIAQSGDPDHDHGSYLVIISRNDGCYGSTFDNANVSYGQQSSLFGKYIGVLATEYYLLMQSGHFEEAQISNAELINALKALQRLDYYCEEIFGCTPTINGYYIRSDAPPGTAYHDTFLYNHPELNHYDGLLISSDPLLDTTSSPHNVRQIDHYGPCDTAFTAYQSMSQDEAIFTLEGLALAYKFGSTEVSTFARELAIKIITYCYGKGDWIILNCIGGPVELGPYCIAESPGFVAAATFFSDTNSYLVWDYLWNSYFFGAGGSTARHMVASLTAIGGTAAYPSPQTAIYNNCDNDGWQTYYLWLYMALHDDYSPMIEVGNVEDQLDDAPCEGPWRKTSTLHSGYGWCTPDRWYHKQIELNGGASDVGIFSGIDYMLLLNLYYICSGQGLTEYRNRTISILTQSWPQGIVGSTTQPRKIDNFRSIRSKESINNENPSFGDVTYKAGTEIFLEPGFEAEIGSFFSAEIQPLEYCQNSSFKHLNNDIENCKTPPKLNIIEDFESDNNLRLKSNNSSKFESHKPTLVIYPNPTEGFSTINLSEVTNFQIIIQSMTGAQLFNEVVHSSDHYNLNIEDFENGIYIIKIILENQIITNEIIKLQ